VITIGLVTIFIIWGLLLINHKVKNLGEVPKEKTSTQESTQSKKRALIILVESNAWADAVSRKMYNRYGKASNLILAYIFDTDPENLRNKTLEEILEIYGEDWLINEISEESVSYDKTLELIDRKASFDNLTSQIQDLSKEGYTVDLILDIHGSKDSLCFYNKECINQQTLTSSLTEDVDIGYVYQTACYGKYFTEAWITIGAKVVNGSEAMNSFVIFAPKVFLQKIQQGHNFEESVEAGYTYELSLWSSLEKIHKNFSWINKDIVAESKMTYSGDLAYQID
jgi:hypothetical protein